MNPLTAFRKLWLSTGSTATAAQLMGYARVVQVAGWDALDLPKSKRNGVRSAFVHAEVVPEEIAFAPRETQSLLSPEEIESLREEAESEFEMVAVNRRGRMDKKSEWRNRRQNIEKEPDDGTD